MMRLLIAGPGEGKSYWLSQQQAEIFIDCTLLSHWHILEKIALEMNIEIPKRATIADILELIQQAQPAKIAFDNIDRAPAKFIFSILAMAEKHEILATATEKKRIRPILERRAAVIVPAPRPDIRKILSEKFPDLPPEKISRISMTANTPGEAIQIAKAISEGQEIPQPQPRSLAPILIIVGLSAITFIRYYSNVELNPAILAALTGIAFLIRRLGWKKIE